MQDFDASLTYYLASCTYLHRLRPTIIRRRAPEEYFAYERDCYWISVPKRNFGEAKRRDERACYRVEAQSRHQEWGGVASPLALAYLPTLPSIFTIVPGLVAAIAETLDYPPHPSPSGLANRAISIVFGHWVNSSLPMHLLYAFT